MSLHRSATARDFVITCIKGEGALLKFWALPITALDTVKNFESRLATLKPELDASPAFARSDQIPIGLRCVAKAKTKQYRWCRAGVLAHQGYNAVLVRLLDYGNDEGVSISDIRILEDPIMSVQPQAFECILADVTPAHNEWTLEAIKFCEQHLLYNTLSCFVVSEYMKLPVVRVAKKGESEAFVQRLINGGLALIKREIVSPPPVISQLSYKINTLDSNSKHLVRISCFENAQKFYVQLSAAEMELKHLMDSINRLPKDNYSPLKVPAINTPCLALLSSKPCYYRTLITHIQQSQCKVFFVDYGFSELKNIHELRAIPPSFLNLAAQAICCSLPREASIDPEEFKRFIGLEHLELHVISRTNESYIVRLFYHGHDLLMPAQTNLNYIPHKLNIGVKYDVSISYINDISEFYCQPTQLKEQLDMISNILNSGYNFLPVSLHDCTPGKPVCAKFSDDNQWYRARIMKVNHENDIEVFFVDFGNYDNVNLGDVKKIGPDLIKYPIQAFKCFLHDTPLPTDSKARDDAFDLLEELTTDQILLAHINTFSGDAGYGVTLYMKNSPSSVNEKLLSKCVPASVPVVPVNNIEDIYVTSFDSCNSFFVQFEKLDSEKLAIMQEEINTFYSGMQNSSFVPKEGNLVCARFHEDDQFYRARIEKCRDRQCDVFFIDYGNRETISLTDVHCIDLKFTQYPQFGTECAFENFLSQVPNDKLSEVMLENSFKLKMNRQEGEKWYVSLVENFPGNAAIWNLVKQNEVSRSSSRSGERPNVYQEKRISSQPAHSDSSNDNTHKSSHFTNRNEIANKYSSEPAKKEPFSSPEPVQEFEEYSLISIPPKACRNVYVSHIVNPSEFYCQIEEDSSKLQLLMKSIEDIYASGTNVLSLTNFTVGSPCCAMYDEDGAWYRGKIKKVGVDTCDIFFVDYGNTDPVSKSKIKKLRNDLFRWPSQAVCCKVFNVSPKSGDWSDGEIDVFTDKALDKSFIAQFVECDNNNCYSVNLIYIDDLENNIFNKEFVSLGYGRLQDTSKSIILNPHAASTNLSFNALDVKIGCSEPVQVFFGLNPGEIYCQLKSYEQEFKQMMIKMQSYYKNVSEAESLIDRPHQGMICAAQFSLDSAWYRAEIKKVETNKVIVFYVDYGNSEKLDRKKVKCIIQEYTALPVQAIKCRIRGIKPPGKSWTINNNLGKYFEGNAVCKFIAKEDESYLVDITCNQKDVAQCLISDGIAASDASISQIKDEYPQISQPEVLKPHKESPKVDESKVIQNVTERKDNFTRGQLLSVTMSFIENPLKFWCQLLDESDYLNDLVEKIESEVADYPPLSSSSVKIGSYCMAQYSEDEAWYRARIISSESGNTYKVFFIDYGNSEVVSLSEMKEMTLELVKQPPFCFQCCLYNAPSKLPPEMTTLFSDAVADVEEITAKIETISSGIYSVTLLFDKDDQEVNVNELLFGVKENIIEDGGASYEPPRISPPDVPLGLHEGYVSVVKSPQDFYIQLSGTEDPLADLSEELAELSESALNVNSDNLCIGYACSTKYSEDNNWYRAEVIDIQDSTVTVLFVDYGNIETVEKSTLKCLSDKHLQMPSQAIKCKLNGIVPVGEEWTEEAINTFQDMVLDASLGIVFISKDIPATVNITKDDKEVAQCLVDMEVANFETCTETDEAYAEDHLAPAPLEDPLSSLPNDQSYPERKLSSLKHTVKICYVDSYDKFYITPLELSTELDTVSATLEILYDSTDSTESGDSKSTVTDVLEDPKVSMPCVAKYTEDDKWYRAIITEIEEENIFVTFIDFGNSEISNISNLRPLPPELLKIPPIALECSLFGIIAKSGKEQEITTKLEEYFLDEVELEVEIIEFSPYKVKLFLNGEDVSSFLIKEGLAEEQCTMVVGSESFVDSSKMTFVDESLEYRIQISKRFFSDADKIVGNVKFCEIENDLIVFHVVSTDLEDDLQDLQQKLQDAYSEPSQNLTHLSCMDFCATKYMEDGNWYRAQVLSIEKDKIKVRFIDYGNCETVDKSDIYELLADFTIEPQFSVKCILFGLKVDKSKEVELQNKLDEYVYHEPVELKLCKHAHAVYDLCITSVLCGNTDITELISEDKLVHPQYIINGQLEAVFKATIQKIENDVVFLLPLNVIDEREAFQCKLQNLCKDSEKLMKIQVGHLCAARVDDIWYRACVMNISECEVTVDLVDFGLVKVTKDTEFVPLLLDICHQPIFLQPCVVHVADSTGNAKSIRIEDLNIGCEVSCELQKNYPSVQPLSVKIVEIHSGVKQIESETGNDLESVADDSKERMIDSDKEECASQNKDDSKEHLIDSTNEECVLQTGDDSKEHLIDSANEECASQNEDDSKEHLIDSTNEECVSQNETTNSTFDNMEIENHSSINESVPESQKENYSENENMKPEIEPSTDSKMKGNISSNLNEETHANDDGMFVKELNETIAHSNKMHGDMEIEDYESSVENVESVEKINEEICVNDDMYVEEISETIAHSKKVHEDIEIEEYESSVETYDEDHKTFKDEQGIPESDNLSDECHEHGATVLSQEFDESRESCEDETNKVLEIGTDKLHETVCVNSIIGNEINEENEKNCSFNDIIEQQPSIKKIDEFSTHIGSFEDHVCSTEENSSELSNFVKEETVTDSKYFAVKSDKECSFIMPDNELDSDLLNSNNLDEHFTEQVSHDNKINKPLDEISKNHSIIDQSDSLCELKADNTNSVDDVNFQLEHEEQETSDPIYYCTKNERSVINSLEDTEPKENNRAIEDSYQLTGLVPVKVSHIAISDGSVIFAVQPLYLHEEFLLLKESIQEFYSSKAVPYDVSSYSQFCVVYHEGEWCRGKILQTGDTTILLIDYGKCTSVDSSEIKKLDNAFNVPPFAVWCTLSSATCPAEKIEATQTFLCDKLKDKDAVVKILEGGEPYKISMFINGESILNLLLKNSLVIQKLPNMYLEPGPHKAKLSFLNIFGPVEIFVNLTSFCEDYNALFEDMQSAYKTDDYVSNIVKSGIYATFYNDSWYRGQVISSSKETQVYLVDTGESIADCRNLCFLLPEHCLQPPFAIPCHIPLSDIQATNEIFESINAVLKAAEFLVDIKLCPNTNSLSATLIDEQIMSEVKNIGLTCLSTDSEAVNVKTEDNVDNDISISNDIKLSHSDSSSTSGDVQKHDISDSNNVKLCFDSFSTVNDVLNSEQLVDYVEETFTAEP